MTKRESTARSFVSPSPGEILRSHAEGHQSVPPTAGDECASAQVDVACDPFAAQPFVQALCERGVMLAPLLVQWNYKVPAALPFAKWLKTKELLLSDARLRVNDNTTGVHYFGTYILQNSVNAEADASPVDSRVRGPVTCPPVACQTLWGFGNEAAMTHMFDLCRGRIDRVSIVQNDLRDFVLGLKGYVSQAGQAHFSQTVLLAPAAM